MYKLFRSSRTRATIERLYGAIVAQSRQVAFYADLGVPDTPNGRFEMVLLHTVLVCRRLKGGNEAERALSQDIFDAFAADMDASLREMGVSDLGVPKRMKKIGAAFYGRAGAYDAALGEAGQGEAEGQGSDPAALARALGRSILGRDEPSPQADALAAYVRQAAGILAALPFDAITRGELGLPVPPAAPQTGG